MPGHPAIKGKRPWPSTSSAEVAQAQTAPAREEAFTCERGHSFSLRFYAGAEVPEAWDCRCGKPAHRKGAPKATPGKPSLPGYATHGKYERPAFDDVTPMGQLRKRRTKKELEALLAERMAEVRQSGVAR